MEIIGSIIGFLIVAGIFILFLGAFGWMIMSLVVMWKCADEEIKGKFFDHDGWEDGTWRSQS